MKHASLGASGLTVSRYCFGTMNLVANTPWDESFRMLDLAIEGGINLIDTANFYGGAAGMGATESCIGEWLVQGNRRRDRVILATKIFAKMDSWPHSGGLSALSIRREIDASLKRLQTDHIDILQLHHVDRSVRWEEIWQAIDTAIVQGKIVYAGSSNFAGWHIAAAQGSRKGKLGLVSEQSVYNLANRAIELEVLPAAEAHGMGVLAWSPLQGGLLAGACDGPAGGTRRRSADTARLLKERYSDLQSFERLCAEIGAPPAAVALAWLVGQPGVHGPVIGPRTTEHLMTLLGHADLDLDDDARRGLDQIFPGYAPAPEHYAW